MPTAFGLNTSTFAKGIFPFLFADHVADDYVGVWPELPWYESRECLRRYELSHKRVYPTQLAICITC